MLSTRLVVGLAPAFKRTVFRQQSILSTRNQAVLLGSVIKRGIQIERAPAEKELENLNAQRLHRPNSPHFTIYQPQLTWLGSIAHRFSGGGLSILLYGFTLSYVISPFFGLSFTSENLIALVGSLPESVKYTAKFILAAPFTFHCWNGMRHLAWDTGRFLTLKGAYASGYAVIGATIFSTAALLMI